MNSIARVVVNIPGIKELFDYDIPDGMDNVSEGSLVVVQFGNLRAQAVVVEIARESAIQDRKNLLAVLDAQPVITRNQILLANWMAKHFYSALSDCVHLMLPAGMNQMADVSYSIVEGRTDWNSLPVLQQKILQEIQQRGALRSRQIKTAFPHVNWKTSVQALMRKGYLKSQPILPEPKIQRKTIRTAQISIPRTEVDKQENELGRIGSAAFERRKAAVEFLLNEGIPVNVAWVYASSGANAADLRILEEKGFIRLGEVEIWRDPLEHIEVSPAVPPELTSAQSAAWGQIEEYLQQDKDNTPLLVHGVTGSGKTELYLRAVQAVIEQGKQVIVLVPEISLTPQTVKRFMARFPGQVGLIHSRLSIGERYDTWRRARLGKLPIIIGPRSALFAPLPNLGLIVMDEFHDPSFYQTESSPAYDAVQTGLTYANIVKGKIILGSATPTIDIYFRAQSEGWQMIHLPDRILAHQEYIRQKNLQFPQGLQNSSHDGKTAAALPLPLVRIVDMRNELRQGNRSIFSRSLQSALKTVLEREQQAILFLNRRGSSTYVFCRECGNVLRCPRCELPLTTHADVKKLMCHVCGYTRNLPTACPQCGKMQIRQYGSGTQKVEQELSRLFPSTRILRWDADTARQKGAEELLLSHFANHHADFLIGTQMLAKGLDLPLVTLVGIVLADVGLNFPDYRAAERSFQVLSQVAGRSGRSPLGGQVILQTYQPDHAVIQRVSRHDFSGFYSDEIIHRRELKYPPFSELVRLEYRHHDSALAQQKAEEIRTQLEEKIAGNSTLADILISGPVPPFFQKIRGLYRQQLILRGKDLTTLLQNISMDDWRVEVNPPDIL